MDPQKQSLINNQTSDTNVPPDEDKKKIKLVERLVELDLGLRMVVGALILFIGIFVLAWRMDLIGYFNKSNKPESVKVVSQPKAVVAAETAPVFTNSQKVEIEKAFQGEPPLARLTLGGQLKKEVFGFLPYWVFDRIDQIDLRMVTSVSYFGLEVDGKGNILKTGDGGVGEAWQRWQDPKLDEFIKKAKKNKTKVYVTLKSFNNQNIEELVNSQENFLNFFNNAMYLVNSKSLDGINIDFEYVGTPSDKTRDNFSIMIKNLSKELKRQYPKALLSVCTYIDAASQTRLYDVSLLSQYADSLVIMGYDFHTPNSTNAGPVAPMEGYGNSLTGLMASYLGKSPASKLILAVPYYGYDWPLNDSGQVLQGGEVRAYPYGEIASNTKNTQINWDDNAKTPWYSYVDNGQKRVVHFENTRSLGIKYDYINQKNLQGVGLWALGFDGLQTDLNQLLSDKFAKK